MASEPLRTTILQTAHHFDRREVRIVSAYRHPKFNTSLSKKAHQVDRNNKHKLAQAVDFYLPGISVKKLHRWLRHQHQGGAGFYLQIGFVDADLDQKRTWRGD